MCGIIGYIGQDKALPILLDGLTRMEYRGYDSAGVAVLNGTRLDVVKRAGKISQLKEALDGQTWSGSLGIGHTRWATHGEPNEVNAHPHRAEGIAIVHNGIIENYAELKDVLERDYGRVFITQTDSEVLAHMIALERAKGLDLPGAVCAALRLTEGTFGLLVADQTTPDLLVAARRGSPVLIGLTDTATYVASDATALIAYTDRILYLEDNEVAICKAGECRIMDLDAQDKKREPLKLELKLEAIERSGYEHFLLKEIMEQPQTITDALRGRLDDQAGTSRLSGLNLEPEVLSELERFITVGCGTAYYAGLLGKYLLERLTGLPVDVEYGSEFRYRQAVTNPHSLGLVISQSGETADTLASLRELKRRAIPTMGLVNVVGSSIAREVDGGVYLHAGPEISVASTKAFTGQVIAQLLVGLEVGRSQQLSVTEGRQVIRALQELPKQVRAILDQAPAIQKLAKQLTKFESAMYLGRDALYPVALEGSHKLKEVSYIHAEAYPAGEMKHGANALIDKDLLVVFLLPKNDLYDKGKSNLEEVRARKATILTIGTEGDHSLASLSDYTFLIPPSSTWTQPLLVNIPLQLLAYYLAVERGTDVDQPRNLAKSVTVE